MRYLISNHVKSKIVSFYHNVAKKYKHTYSEELMHKNIDEAYNSIYNIENGLPRRRPTMQQWSNLFMAAAKQWYFAYRIEGDTIYVEDTCHAQNMKDVNHVPVQQPSGFHFSLNDTQIQDGQYLNGLKVGFNKEMGKYVILKSDNTPFVEKWFDKQPKFFESPYGKYQIIAYVSYNKELYAIGIGGKMYDMNRLWDDAYLSESFMNYIFNETINEYIHSNLITESTTKPIKINESQLRNVIHDIIKKIPHRKSMRYHTRGLNHPHSVHQ